MSACGYIYITPIDFILSVWRGAGLLSMKTHDITCRNGTRLSKGDLHIRKNLFIIRVVRHWNELSNEVFGALCLPAFKRHLGDAPNNVLTFSPVGVRQLDSDIFGGHFQQNYSISMLFLNLCLILQSHIIWARSSQMLTPILHRGQSQEQVSPPLISFSCLKSHWPERSLAKN